MDNKTDNRMKTIGLTLLFFSYCYIYSTVLSFSSILPSTFMDENGVTLSYKLILLSNAIGMAVFGIYKSFSNISHETFRKIIGVDTLITIPLIMLLFTTNSPAAFYISSNLLTFLIGGECVYIYIEMISSFSSRKHTGIIYFIGASLSICLQYLLQTKIGNRNYILYSLLLISFIMALSEFITPYSENEQKTSVDNAPANRLYLIPIALLIIICLEVIGNFLSYSLIFFITDNENGIAYASPRFFIILGYLIMGIAADIKDMKYLPLLTLCGVIIGTLNPVLFNDPSSAYLNTSIFYLAAGFINCFLTLYIWKLARGNRCLPLIAVSGRIIDCIFTLLFMSPILMNMPLPTIIALELFIIIIIMLLMAFSGQLNIGIKSEPNVVIEHISPEEFAAKYDFSDKETEVFLTALEHNSSMSELAKALYISRTVLYKHINRMCEKTETENLREIRKLYYNTGLAKYKPEIEAENTVASDTDNTENKDNKKINETYETNEINESYDIMSTKMTIDDQINEFADKFDLSSQEKEILALFIKNPGMTQKEMAAEHGVTLRTVQRHLANIRNKADVKSMPELNKLFYEK